MLENVDSHTRNKFASENIVQKSMKEHSINLI